MREKGAADFVVNGTFVCYYGGWLRWAVASGLRSMGGRWCGVDGLLAAGRV